MIVSDTGWTRLYRCLQRRRCWYNRWGTWLVITLLLAMFLGFILRCDSSNNWWGRWRPVAFGPPRGTAPHRTHSKIDAFEKNITIALKLGGSTLHCFYLEKPAFNINYRHLFTLINTFKNKILIHLFSLVKQTRHSHTRAPY